MIGAKYVYIDGTNLLTEIAKVIGISLNPSKPPVQVIALVGRFLKIYGITSAHRVYWFGSYTGDSSDEERILDILRNHGFEGQLFKRRESREKGVDIALTKEMLVHAFQRNCGASYLVAGDEDYVGLVNEVKRYGQSVVGAFFPHATSPHLRRALDSFIELRALQTEEWRLNCQMLSDLFPQSKAKLPSWYWNYDGY